MAKCKQYLLQRKQGGFALKRLALSIKDMIQSSAALANRCNESMQSARHLFLTRIKTSRQLHCPPRQQYFACLAIMRPFGALL